jgi:hypothetical protein
MKKRRQKIMKDAKALLSMPVAKFAGYINLTAQGYWDRTRPQCDKGRSLNIQDRTLISIQRIVSNFNPNCAADYKKKTSILKKIRKELQKND